jgi:hypothetical protein
MLARELTLDAWIMPVFPRVVAGPGCELSRNVWGSDHLIVRYR